VSRTAYWLATWLGCGRVPHAPGTAGSLAALPLGALLLWQGGPLLLMAGALAVLVAGFWASARYVEATGEDDPGPVVIDEVAGQLIALVPVGLSPLGFLVAFVLFRVLDIAKPWPAGWIDRELPGAPGIMLDDVVAGVYAGIATVPVMMILS
jgi:phosphatidylglycerophosphatase A